MTVALAPETLAPRPPGRRRGWPPRTRRRRPWPVPVVALVVLALWGAALPGVHARGGGPAVPPVWFAAFGGAVLLYAAVLLSRRPRAWEPAVCALVLLAVLPGTTAFAGPAAMVPPRLAAAFPGARALAALGPARWATPVLALLTAAALWWLVGAFSAAPRARWGAVLLAVLGAWTGPVPTPQAVALPLSLVLLGGLLRAVPPGPDGVRWAALRRLPARRDDVPTAFWRSRWGALLLAVLFALVAVTDLVAPVVLLAQAAAVATLLRPARPWLVLVLLALEEGWLLQARPQLPAGTGSPPGWAAAALMAVVALLAVAAVAVALAPPRRDGRVVVPAALALLALGVAAAGRGDGGLVAGYLLALPHLATAAALVLSPPSS